MGLHTKIKEVRETLKKTQQECADAVGVTLRAWQNYEQGNREPKFEMLCDIANLFNVSLDYLLGRESKPPDSPINIFAKDASLKELEKILIKRYLELTDKQREAVLEFMRNAIAEEQTRKTALKQKDIKHVMQAARDGEVMGIVETTTEEETKLINSPLLNFDL